MSKLRNLFVLSTLLLFSVSQVMAFPSGGSPSNAETKAQEQAMEQGGTVVQTMDAGGYTYALIEKDGMRTWVAMPTTELQKGDEIVVSPGRNMKNFTSNSLNRTFENIYFTPGVVVKR